MATRFGFLSTFPPTLCGLATFNESLFNELIVGSSDSGAVVRVVDSPQPSISRAVVAQLVNGDSASVGAAVKTLNAFDVVIVQHEYGIFGGADGDEVLHVLRALKTPTIVVLHTVLSAPTEHQRYVLETVIQLATSVVTLTQTARERLATSYDADMTKVFVIPHGAQVIPRGTDVRPHSTRPTILTWGLIGRGKGIEWGIDAMSKMTDMSPRPCYIVAGQTHPKVLAFEGETYRKQLSAQVQLLGLGSSVTLENYYRPRASLMELVRSADVVLLPYDTTEQVTSGVLAEAVAAQKPIVATPFPHAVELLTDGAGVLVPHRDPTAIAEAIRTILADGTGAQDLARVSDTTVAAMSWATVADSYRKLAQQSLAERVSA